VKIGYKLLEYCIAKNRRLEIATRLSSNPNYSVTKLTIQKIRVFVAYLVFTMVSLGDLRASKKVTNKQRNKHSGKIALVIAGGPSANNLDVEVVVSAQRNNELDVFAMNWFTHTPLANQLTPDFYVLTDPINRVNREGTFKSRNSNQIWDVLSTWKETKLIVPHYWRADLEYINNEVTLFIDDRELVGFTKSILPTKPRGYSSLTALKTLAAAVYMGYKEIYVIGLDGTAFKSLYVTKENLVYEGNNNLADSDETPGALRSDGWPNGMSDMLYAHSHEFLDVKRCFHDKRIFNINVESMHDGISKCVESRFVKKN
jgi:hypothetical protein